MALHELTVLELDAVCGGRNRPARIDVDVNVVKIDQQQYNSTHVFLSKKVDASNNQTVVIGSVG